MNTQSDNPYAGLMAEIALPIKGELQTITLTFVPDYGQILREINSHSAVPLSMEAVLNFARLFFETAHAEMYDSGNIYSRLDPYVKDARYLLGIKVQKVNQAFELRASLLTWMETVRCYIRCTAKEISMID